MRILDFALPKAVISTAKSASASTSSGHGLQRLSMTTIKESPLTLIFSRPVFVHEQVEGAVEHVEEPHQVGRRGAARVGEADDVGEQNEGLLVFVGDDAAVGFFEP